MVMIYGKAHGHSELARQIYGERFLQRSQCTNLCKRCAASSRFGRFEMNRERHFQQSFSINVWVGIVENHLVGLCVLPHL
jgi:hypothetical protein